MALFLVSGCAASAVDTARDTLGLVARAGSDADDRLEARINAVESEAELPPYEMAARYLATLRRALLAAEDALDAWDVAGEANGFLRALGCVAEAIRDVAWAFAEAGLSIPFSVSKAEHALRSAPRCEASK